MSALECRTFLATYRYLRMAESKNVDVLLWLSPSLFSVIKTEGDCRLHNCDSTIRC